MLNIKDSKILFVGAHTDDIEIGCFGLINDLAKEERQNEITCLSLSHYNDKEVFQRNLNDISMKIKGIIKNNNSLFFERNLIKDNLMEFLYHNYDYIFFHSSIDNHNDHKIVNDICNEIFRPLINNNLKGLIEFNIPLNTHLNLEYFNYFYNYAKDSNERYNKKIKYLARYEKIRCEAEDRRGLQFFSINEKTNALFAAQEGYSEAYKIKFWKN